MADANIEFTEVTNLGAEALGEPGNRTFRILVNSGDSSAVLGVEKEQLFQLAMAVQQLFSALPEQQGVPGVRAAAHQTPGQNRLDFKAEKLALGYDAESGTVVIDAYDSEEEQGPATVRVWVRHEQVKGFSEEALRVCAAGRPPCPLCGNPGDAAGHVCPRVNGHRSSAKL